jgi:hypothetical protein
MTDDHFNQLMNEIRGTNSRLQALEDAFVESKRDIAKLKAVQVSQAPAPAVSQAPAIAPAINTEGTFPANIKSIPFRADEIGYFDPDLDESHEGVIATIGKDLWFREASYQPSSSAWYRTAPAPVGLRISGGAVWL